MRNAMMGGKGVTGIKRYLPLALALCLFAGCGEKADIPIGPTPDPTPEPTEISTPVPEPAEAPTPAPAVEPALPEGVSALLDLSDTDYVMDQAAGDLNGDGLEDWAVVIEHLAGVEYPDGAYRDAPRAITILLGDKNGGYTLGQTNDHFIRRADQGGVYGDPYEGIDIDNGKLHYGDYGGSAWRWGNDYTFSWQGDGLALTRLETMTMYGERGIEECYDLEKGRYVQRAFSEGGWDCGTGLLWEQEISASGPKLEEMPNAWDEEPWLDELPPLPSLGFYGYEERQPLEERPEEILDRVRRERFPGMSRVDLPWTEETRSNYARAAGWEVPGYYYADGEGRLSWYEGNSVMYESFDGKTLDFY